ncbi:MAG: 4-hydroxy-3-methylbut-2-enyl diphosphate reductase [Ignavibacteriaceae bacterium]|nr:4-hydroxy-3-methylbut-2-enyl diphosphate reductase [Ignavibacteriaceae bacterium]
MKQFDIPQFYRSSFITKIKNSRKDDDPRKKDYSPTLLDFGPVRFYLARHFGFCYGVENAIEIAYRTVEENPDKRIFLLSEMIHNPGVNENLEKMGIKFLMDTSGNELLDWNELTEDDIVIIPAFGTTIEIEKRLNDKGINPYQYNTTCPFVEKVWNRSSALGKDNHTIVIHGKHLHEETRATFSQSQTNAPSLIVRDLNETKILGSIILGKKSEGDFYSFFKGKYSDGFNVREDLEKIGVVNQTTMLATETQEIAEYLKSVMIEKYGIENLNDHFADTRDTLCYATNDNQEATYGLLKMEADLAIVVGGYNSSNTGHIVELCREKLPTYFISSEEKILDHNHILHFDIKTKQEKMTNNYLPLTKPVTISLTSGASCPDATVEAVLRKLLSFFDETKNVDEVVETITVAMKSE